MTTAYEETTERDSWAWDGFNFVFLGIPDKIVEGTQNGWDDFKKEFFGEPDSSGPTSGVKGVPAPDGGVPQTKGFFDKVGDAIVAVAQPPSGGEVFKDSLKWVAIGVAAFAGLYVVAKVL